MNIAVITPYYSPDLGPSSPLITVLCEGLATKGHQVTVLSAVPHYPTGRVAKEYRGKLWKWERRNSVFIWRLWVPSGNRLNLVHRMLTFIVYQVLSALKAFVVKADAVIITNPAIETFLPFVVISWLRHLPILYCVWDLYPEVGVQLGVFSNPLVIRLVGSLENLCLNRANVVQSLANSFIDNLEDRVSSRTKIVFIPPWIDTNFIRPLPKNNSFAKEFGLTEYFTIIYAGNIGLSQGLEVVLQVAQKFKKDGEIRFVFVGDGMNKNELQNQAVKMNLRNVLFIDSQPKERLPEVLAAADVSLVSMKSGLEKDLLPSKTFPILASGRPILALVDLDSELGRLISISQSGVCLPSNNTDEIIKAILDLKYSTQKREVMGMNGRKYALNHHSKESALEAFEALLMELGK